MPRNILLFIGIVVVVVLLLPTTAPFSFPSNTIVAVSEGIGLHELSEELEDRHVIRSPFWFRTFAIILGGEREMKAGQYYLSKPQNAFTLAWRIFHGDYDVETVKITIPEGFTVEKISNLFDERFVSFDKSVFKLEAPEGYLFPDTYFIQVTATASSTIQILRDNFDARIASVMEKVEDSGRTLEEIIIMASLLEGEAKTKIDREIVSGILWKRLKIGMPLQVDSEMGTYEYRGLPERPINNPGLVSIEAALSPTTTEYLYFLTGHDGNMYYAKTFDEHKRNIAKHLSN